MRRLQLAARVALVAVAAAVSVPSLASAAVDPHPVTAVDHVDVSKYLGDWYQVGAKPQWFEALCLSNVKANYTLNADGSVKVTNTCAGPLGATIKTVGKAKVLDTASNAKLEVSFLSVFGAWYFTGKPNYEVLGLGANYDWAVVGDPARSSGFILSRTPTITDTQRFDIYAALLRSGYKPCDLARTVQTGGFSSAGSFCSTDG